MPRVNRVLVLFAHPALHKSRVNRAWLSAIAELDGVTIRDLYQQYPDFDVDPQAEQEVLLEHDVVVFQHPMYWYSTPALLKQWFDLVLQHGWAYGTHGTRLAGKIWLSAITTGAPLGAYHPEGFHGATVSELLSPIEATARLCRMTYLPPFIAHGAASFDEDQIKDSALVYGRVLSALRDGRIESTAVLDEANFSWSSLARAHLGRAGGV